MVILFEGTCGVGKTSLVRRVAAALQAGTSKPTTTFFQDKTYGPVAPLEDAATLDDATNVRLLRMVIDEIAGHVAAGNLVLVDTLHITQRVRPGVIDESSFRVVDRVMAALPTLVCFLEARCDTILERAVVGRRGSGFRRYAKKFAPDEQLLAEYFFDEQARMKSVLEEVSTLERTTLSAETAPAELCERVIEFAHRHPSFGT